ncbi:single-stranded DNA-binding protein [Christensenella intestinihominis]|uniref:single-stranded DNA-binding protein n=1 Tax=Christensenella intestinihominis TaxID=1851429 RepID=UPI00082BAE52|nr:single-stranded DNA-binding protein [Christensenella intestinihominis]
MSINKAVIVGNLTRSPEQKTTPNGISVTSFTVAVNRRYKSQDGQQQTDFINCVAWRVTAEFIAKYFSKGSRIGVVGTIQTRNYEDQNGVRRYVTEIVVDEAEFMTSKAQSVQKPNEQESRTADELFAEDLADFQPLDDAELPF